MSSYDQHQAPPQVSPLSGSIAAEYPLGPPPPGYPVKDGMVGFQQQGPVETRSRNGDDDGFWKGCCAAMCCCCLLDMCA